MKRGKLVAASFGLNVHQLTPEAREALRGCDRIYSDALSGESRAFLEQSLPCILPLDGREPEEIAEFLISQVRSGLGIGYLTYGDPLFLNQCSELLLERCRREGLPHRACPGISHVNELIGALGLAGHDSPGVYLCWAGAPAYAFHPAVPALVFLFRSKPEPDEGVRRLLRAIRAAYPAGHPAELVTCAYGVPPRRAACRVEDLERAYAEADVRATLYLPSAAAPAPATGL